jgi:hypothetical protein
MRLVATASGSLRSSSIIDRSSQRGFDGRSRRHQRDFSVVSLKSRRRDFPLAHRSTRRARPRAAIRTKSRSAAPALPFTGFCRFRRNHAFSPEFDALPKVWKSAQKMYLERRNWIDTLQSLHQRRQPRRSGIGPTRQAGNR